MNESIDKPNNEGEELSEISQEIIDATRESETHPKFIKEPKEQKDERGEEAKINEVREELGISDETTKEQSSQETKETEREIKDVKIKLPPELGGTKVTVHVSGEGPGVFIIHGWKHSGLRFEGLLKQLEGYKICAIDLPGFGQSEPLKDNITLEQFTKIAEHTIRETIGDGVHAILGDSMGAIIASKILENGEIKARKAILQGIPADGGTKKLGLKIAARVARVIPGVMKQVEAGHRELNNIPDDERKERIRMESVGVVSDIEKIDERYLQDSLESDPHTTAVISTELANVKVNEIKHNPGAELLITRGELDTTLGEQTAKRLTEASGANYYEFKGSSHTPQMETPEGYLATIQSYLDE